MTTSTPSPRMLRSPSVTRAAISINLSDSRQPGHLTVDPYEFVLHTSTLGHIRP